jgi:hypothetical protein
MGELAVVIVTCDKYQWIWDTWYYYFKKYWGVECPVYFCNETIEMNYPDIKQILVDIPGAKKWTKRLRESVKQIPEKHLFILMEDILFNKNIDELFVELYALFRQREADALRIRYKPTIADIRHTTSWVQGKRLKMLSQRSKYLASFSPNIWRKSYLLKCLRKDESIWRCELSGRMRNKGQAVYDYEEPNWYVNAVIKGEVTEQGQNKIDEATMDRY